MIWCISLNGIVFKMKQDYTPYVKFCPYCGSTNIDMHPIFNACLDRFNSEAVVCKSCKKRSNIEGPYISK